MGHLTSESLERLLKRPQDERELFEHLSRGCEECEAYLASSAHPLLDGVTDAALLSLARASAPAEDPRAEATFRRIHAPRTPARSRRWLVALAAMVLAVVALFLLRPRADDLGLKGSGPLTLGLEAVVRDDSGALTRVERGGKVAATGTLLIRYHASEAATARLVLVRNSSREVLGDVKLEAGTHDLERDGALVGVSLTGEGGQLIVRLEAVDSPAAAEVEVDVAP